MRQSFLLGRVIRIAVGPAFDHTRIKFLGVHIRRAWLEAERKSQPCMGNE